MKVTDTGNWGHSKHYIHCHLGAVLIAVCRLVQGMSVLLQILTFSFFRVAILSFVIWIPFLSFVHSILLLFLHNVGAQLAIRTMALVTHISIFAVAAAC